MNKRGNIWFVLADGAKARILQRRSSEPRHFDVVADEQSAEAQLPGHDLGTDRPGRSYESATPSRHAIEGKINPHEAAKLRFEVQIAELVNRAAEQGLFDSLVLVAPPRVLGDMRQALSAQARERLIVEEGKDLLGLPEQMLTNRLTALLRR
jgi:protein required for attachment to host cells